MRYSKNVASPLEIIAAFMVMFIFFYIIYELTTFTSPTFPNSKCQEYCNESYAGKSESGFMENNIHRYKCEHSTLYENLYGNCVDEDGFYYECTKYTCEKRK